MADSWSLRRVLGRSLQHPSWEVVDGGWVSRQELGSLVRSQGRLLPPLPNVVSASSVLSSIPHANLSRWLPMSWPSMEALSEPMVRAPFPGIRGN